MKDPQRLRGSPGFEPPVHAPNAALMIDFDNVTMGIRSDLQTQLKRLLASEIFRGKVSVQRAYADWRRYPQYIVPLSESSIDLTFAPAFGSNKKNATDIRLAIDATELVFTRPEIGTFILLSGDSDFSSLVLKLKEYGKYVIGVGIRESSSDLLIQNCDEYYSYNELTGLAKESDIEHPRHDPWELVVTAVTQMKRNRDVMRSDRLKQVMQEIDPNFDEGDIGFSRFSKFVQEASQRGLVTLTKLDNGQYEIDVGSNANVPPAVESELATVAQEAERRHDRRPRGGRDRGERGPHKRGATLAQAFDALRLILLDLGAVKGESTDPEQVRERMLERFGADDPIMEENRFKRLLRQAHDASVIELIKRDDETYLLRLTDAAMAAGEQAHVSEPAPRERDRDGDRGRDRGRRGGRGRGGRGRRGEGRGEGSRHAAEETESPAPVSEPSGSREAVSPQPPAGGQDNRRSVRFRSGSRRLGPAPAAAGPSTGAPPIERPPAPEAPAAPPTAGPANRSVRGRQGSRGGPRRGQENTPGESANPAPASHREEPQPAPRPEPSEPAAPKPALDDSKSIFKRLSGALQKALGGDAEP